MVARASRRRVDAGEWIGGSGPGRRGETRQDTEPMGESGDAGKELGSWVFLLGGSKKDNGDDALGEGSTVVDGPDKQSKG